MGLLNKILEISPSAKPDGIDTPVKKKVPGLLIKVY